MKRSYVACLAAVSLVACDSDPSGPSGDPDGGGPETPAVASIGLESSVMMLWNRQATTVIVARAFDSKGGEIPGVSFVWTTKNPEIATVSDGIVSATGDGWTEVMASAGGIQAGASIVVVTPDGPLDRTDCMACHAAEFVGQHGTTGFPETCLRCHPGPTWSGAVFDHASASGGFELVGAHTSLGCTSCHQADGTPKWPGVGDGDCVACHQSDYDGQHGGSGYPTTCLTCHSRDGWSGAVFDHDAQQFPIFSGEHEGKWGDCTTCHFDPADYSRFTCLACHKHEQSEMDDEHKDVSGYAYDSARCYSCHPRGEEP